MRFKTYSQQIKPNTIIALFISILLCINNCYGDYFSIFGLGTNTSGNARLPVALSTSGNTLAGIEYNNSNSIPFIWDLNKQLPTVLSMPSNCLSPTVISISGDGKWIIGTCSINDSVIGYRASLTQFELLNGREVFSEPKAISYDGQVIVGSYVSLENGYASKAFVWRERSGMELVPLRSHDFSEATFVSNNGNVIAGSIDGYSAFILNSDGSTRELEIAARLISANDSGTILLGEVEESFNLKRAFILSDNVISFLDDNISNGRTTEAIAITTDGSTIVGNMSTGLFGPTTPYIWRNSIGIKSFNNYLSESGVVFRWNLDRIVAMSANGRIFVGFGVNQFGSYEGWLISINEGANIDLNQDGELNDDDITIMYRVWEAGEEMADINQDGGVDGQDIGTFFEHYLFLRK